MADTPPEDGNWYQGANGKWYPPVIERGKPLVPGAVQPQAQPTLRSVPLPPVRDDSLGQTIETVGFVLLALSVIGGGVYVGLAIAEESMEILVLGVVLVITASVQCLLLAGFGRLIRHAQRSADLQEQTVELLLRAVED